MKKKIKCLATVTNWTSPSTLVPDAHRFDLAGLIEYGKGISMIRVEMHVYDPGLIEWLKSNCNRDILNSLQLTLTDKSR